MCSSVRCLYFSSKVSSSFICFSFSSILSERAIEVGYIVTHYTIIMLLQLDYTVVIDLKYILVYFIIPFNSSLYFRLRVAKSSFNFSTSAVFSLIVYNDNNLLLIPIYLFHPPALSLSSFPLPIPSVLMLI